jgi:hypothetical protein
MKDLNYQLKILCLRNRDGSHATQAARERNLSLIANQLHELGFRHMNSHSLKTKHIKSLINHWKSDSLAVGTIKNRLAHLRWWAEKVGKVGVIPNSNDALNIERRVYVTNNSKARILSDELLAKISDERIKISLELQAAFGLRTEESLKFRPSIADKKDHIWLKGSWCKGGQERTIPILNDYQKDVLARAHKAVGKGSMIPDSLTYIAQLNKYKTECYKVGLSKMHGHRHAYAQRRYQELTGWKAPADGGPTSDQLNPIEKQIDAQARLLISEELGHHREEITAVYLGR